MRKLIIAATFVFGGIAFAIPSIFLSPPTDYQSAGYTLDNQADVLVFYCITCPHSKPLLNSLFSDSELTKDIDARMVWSANMNNDWAWSFNQSYLAHSKPESILKLFDKKNEKNKRAIHPNGEDAYFEYVLKTRRLLAHYHVTKVPLVVVCNKFKINLERTIPNGSTNRVIKHLLDNDCTGTSSA